MNIQDKLIACEISLSQALYMIRSKYSDQLEPECLDW